MREHANLTRSAGAPSAPAKASMSSRTAPSEGFPGPGAAASLVWRMQQGVGNAATAAWLSARAGAGGTRADLPEIGRATRSPTQRRPVAAGATLQRALRVRGSGTRPRTRGLVEWILNRLNLVASPELAQVVRWLQGSRLFHLDIVVQDKAAGLHLGDTGINISDQGAPSNLLEYKFLEDPTSVLQPSAVSITVTVHETEDLAQLATTLLHELELHVVPAAMRCIDYGLAVLQEPFDVDAVLRVLVEQLAREQDEHGAMDRLEEFVRSGARLATLMKLDDAPLLAQAIDRAIGKDAVEQLTAFERRQLQTTSPDRVTWLLGLCEAVRRDGPSAAAPPRPPARELPPQALPGPAALPAVYEGLIACVERRVPFATALRDIPLSVSVAQAIGFYRDQLVPKLLRAMPDRLRGRPDCIVWFMGFYGVPQPMTLALMERPLNPSPQIRDLTLEPIPYPDFWPERDERKDWTPERLVPRSVLVAVQRGQLLQGDRLFVDGLLCRVAVLDAEKLKARGKHTRGAAFLDDGRAVVLWRL